MSRKVVIRSHKVKHIHPPLKNCGICEPENGQDVLDTKKIQVNIGHESEIIYRICGANMNTL